MSDIIVGIDLGTTNSEVAVIRNGKPEVLFEDGDPIMPSCVGLSDDNRLLVGKAARNQYVVAPERTIRSIKRKMGEDVRVQLGDQSFTPQEISAMILRSLCERASRQLNAPVKKAVITVPAYFNDAQRQATREAGELAGIEVMRILNEPTAASLTYDPKMTASETILVYDLGGGTFDVSIVQVEDGVIEVLSSHGDTHLGGDDFDNLLFEHIQEKFVAEHGVDFTTNLASKARIIRAAEEAKKALSDHAVTLVEEEFIAEKNGQALHLSMEIARTEYEDLIRPLLNRTIECVQKALEDCNLVGSKIDKVILVGGSTRTPLISEMLENLLGQAPHQEVNPDLCVALGAAIQAGLIAGMDVGMVLVDISPHALGIKCLDSTHGFDFPYRFAPIIHRNSALPVCRSEIFSTVQDKQKVVEIDVYQGEHDDVRMNHRVGKFTIEGLAAVAAGNQIVVQLDLNLDGMLKVSARERATGLQKQITIDNALTKFENKESHLARQRINKLWQDSFEDLEEHMLGEDDSEESSSAALSGATQGHREAVQAKALIEKAERLLESMDGENRQELEKLMKQIQDALSEEKWSDVHAGCDELSDVLFYLEDA